MRFIRLFLDGVALVLLVCSSSVHGATKKWTGAHLNWEDKANWHGGQMPCTADLVEFDETWAPSAVYVQKNIAVHQLTFPLDGNLVLGDINISISDDTTCQGQPGRRLTYLPAAPGDWDDPGNWESLDSFGSVIDNSKLPVADRLPCKTDVVVFPANESVSIKVTRQVEIGGLLVNNVLLNNPNSASEYLNSPLGSSEVRQVAVNALTVTGKLCALSSLCSCGNSNQMVRRSTCSYATPSCPAVTDCIQPVMLADDCCASCGALFSISVGQGFQLSTFKTAVRSKLQGFNYRIHVKSSSILQLLVTGVRGQQLSSQLYNDLRNPAFGLSSTTPITVQNSAPHPTSPPPRTTTAQPTLQTTQENQLTTRSGHDVITTKGESTLATLCATLEGARPGVVAGQGDGNSNTTTDKEPWYILAAMTGVFLLFAILLIAFLITKQRRGQEYSNHLRSVSLRSTGSAGGGDMRQRFNANPKMKFHSDGDDVFVELVRNAEMPATESFAKDDDDDDPTQVGKTNPLYDSVDQIRLDVEKELNK